MTARLIRSVTSAWIGPRRRWRLTLNIVGLSSVRIKEGRIPSLSLHLYRTHSNHPLHLLLCLYATLMYVSGHISALSDSFERKLETLTNVLQDKFTSLTSSDQDTMSARMPNRSFAAPPEVPVPGPSQGQDPSFPTPEGIVGFHQEFQEDGIDWVPSG